MTYLESDKRINDKGFIELYCYQCKTWKAYTGPGSTDMWAWFPEEQHECRMCYDKSMTAGEVSL